MWRWMESMTLVLVDELLHLSVEPLLMYVEPMMILIVKPMALLYVVGR